MKTLSSGCLATLLTGLLLGQTAFGNEAATTAEELLRHRQTSATGQLLDLQRSGRIASRYEQNLPGRAQGKIYQRYIDSFSHAIPDTYINEEFSE